MPFLESLATGTKILGGLGNLLGGGGDNAYSTAGQGIRGHMYGAAAAGKKLGIHTLSALGVNNPGYTPSNQQPGSGLLEAGQALEDLRANREDKKLAQKQSELIDAEIAESRSRTFLNATNSRRALIGPNSNPTGVTGGIESIPGRDPGSNGDRGTRREPTPDQGATQRVSLGGHDAYGPNPEAFEVGVGELLAGAMIYGPQWLYSRMKQQSIPSRDARDERTKQPVTKRKSRTSRPRKAKPAPRPHQHY